jgi:hypothetical protein
MRAFIVRPFGTKGGVDFDRVERELIDPVLTDSGIKGRTTAEIAHAGNIRTDMFERLLTADLVIADISIHNANVYYELGVRHAFRDRITILLRAKIDEVPFDLKTDRYLEYEPGDPGASIPELSKAIEESTREARSDSPVFLLLPRLEPQDPSTFHVVPQAFAEAVRLAKETSDLPMLAVLSQEIEPFDWARSGRRLVGRAQFELKAWPDARETWEWVRLGRPTDFEANRKLGTVYQRLGDFVTSSLAVDRVLDRDDVSDGQRAEALALRGSNAKQRWIEAWQDSAVEDRQAVALGSGYLYDGVQDYEDGFSEDQNHSYSGINALALTTLIALLARGQANAWVGRFPTDDAADVELRRIDERRAILAAAVRRTLEAAQHRQQRGGSEDDAAWLQMTWADYYLLTSDRASFVKAAYDRARAGHAHVHFSTESAARQLRMYLRLGVLVDNARAGLQALGAEEEEVTPTQTKTRVIVFSGHRIDAPDRPVPRFPDARADQARSMIRTAVEQEIAQADGASVEGIAGGASGGDIIFHEVCAELGIPTSLLLAMPPKAFAARSVADADSNWMERFRSLCERVPPRVLQDSEELPDWLAGLEDYSVWQRSNLWILHNGLARANADVTLIVLWDGKGGDGPGGTQDMVQIARRRGVKVVHLDANELLAPASGADV